MSEMYMRYTGANDLSILAFLGSFGIVADAAVDGSIHIAQGDGLVLTQGRAVYVAMAEDGAKAWVDDPSQARAPGSRTIPAPRS